MEIMNYMYFDIVYGSFVVPVSGHTQDGREVILYRTIDDCFKSGGCAAHIRRRYNDRCIYVYHRIMHDQCKSTKIDRFRELL